MKILLINKSPVVSELLAYALKDTSHSYKEINNFEDLNEEFDLTILDDPLLNNDECSKYEDKPCIILSNKHLVDDFASLSNKALIIQKPFLPSDILEAISSFENELTTAILDKEEVEKIQQLLSGDENNQEMENDINDCCESKTIKKEYKDNISYIFDKNTKAKEEDLIEAILSMKPKKLKKFLKNSNIRLNIEIKEQ